MTRKGSTYEPNIIEVKSYDFALRIVEWYQSHTEQHKEYTLGKQLLRSGTSIGANVAESGGGISSKDFENKLSIAYKEVRETKYWLRLLHDSGYLTEELFNELFTRVDEMGKILFSILRTSGRVKH